jgi:large repetitive protein
MLGRLQRALCTGARRAPAMFALVIAFLGASQSAYAQFATGGSGLHRGRIFWVDWGNNGENVFAGRAITRGFNVDSPASPANRLDITCSLSNALTTRGTANQLFVYTPGSWQGDGLDELYNIGGNHPGTGSNPNTLSIGLSVPGGATVEFDFNCSATLGGQPFLLNGLVFADAEASGGIEYSAARLTNGGVLRIIDSVSNCGRAGTVNVTTGGGFPEIRLVPGAQGSCESLSPASQRAGPALVGFIDGATAARVIAQGGGISAVAVGAVLELEFSEAIPASYGVASHILDATWSGGVATSGVNYVSRGNLATFAYSPPRLGTVLLPDGDANGVIGGPDVDALPKTTGPLGNGYANVAGPTARGAPYTISGITCQGPGSVAGWIDFNANGQFDAGERSNTVACASGTNTIALTWTTPLGANYVAQPTSYMRLRTAPVAASVASPTGVVQNGETEDYRIVLPPLLADMAASISGFPANPLAGSTVTGTVTCTNNGLDPAVSPTCNVPTANLPAGATVTCTPNPAPNPLAVGSSIACNVSFTAPPSGTVTVSATAGSSTPDPVSANNPASTLLTIVPQADMRAATTVPANPVAGEPVTVSGVCTNNGPSLAAAPTCALSGLPPGATQSCTPSPAPNPLAVGDSITCTATFAAPASGTLNITTTAGTTTGDPNGANNTDTKPLAPAPRADMVATLSGIPPNPPAGSTVNGTATCTNNGPSPAAAPSCNVSSLPAGAAITCTPNPAPNPLPVGQSISCSVSYTVPASGGITITAVAGSTTTDPNPANNSAQASSQTTPQADLQATTTAPATVNAGDVINVSGVCSNAGPSAAAAPSCALSGLPPGTPQTCTPSPAPNPLPVGQSITCSASFAAPGSGPLSITTTAGTTTADPNNANNSDTDPIAITTRADMAAALSGFPSAPTAGSTATGTLTCTNNGPSAAVNASCAAGGLPPGASVSCSPATPVSSLAAGSAISCNVSYPVPASGTVTVTGTAGSSTPDPVPANNTAQSVATVAPRADMQASTTVPPSATAGQPVTVTGVCTNAGPSAAASPTCALSGLPAGATQTCTPAPAPNPLATGASISCSSTFTAPADGAALSITTTAGSATTDPTPANNTDTKPLAATPQSDMQATASGFPTAANAGDSINGTITCTNNGPSAALNPTCSVTTVPAGAIIQCTPDPAPNPLAVGASIVCSVSFVAPNNAQQLTITGVAGSSNPDPSPNNNTAQAATDVAPRADMQAVTTVPATVTAGQSVSVSGVCSNAGPSDAVDAACALSGLPAGTTQSCSAPANPFVSGSTITCTATFTAPTSGTLSITTTASTNTFDPTPANNTDTDPIAVTPQADMAATVSGFPSNPPAGSVVSGQVTCTNNGPSQAANASCVPGGLPPGATVSCTPSSPTAVLGVGASITCNLSYTAPASGGTVTITGSAGSATADPQAGNNSAQQSSTVAPQADMQAVLAGLPTNPAAGAAVTGTATCTNNGPSVAAAPTCVVSGLPPGGTATCTGATDPLAVGSSITCNLSFTAPASGAVNLVATAGSTTADPAPGNNRATAPVAVSPLADMQAVLSGFPATATAGVTVNGTLSCTNAGPSLAANPTCVPGGLPAGATVSCTPAPAPNPLAVGASISCSIGYTPSNTGAVTVTGTAGSSTPDPNGANNAASITTGVIDAVNDSSPAPVNGLAGGVGVPNVLANDSVNGTPVTLATVTLRQTATTNPNVTLDPATGAVNVAPNTPAGSYVVSYEICTRTAPVVCDTASATIAVNPAPIDAVNDAQLAVGPSGGTSNVLGNDTLNGAPVVPAAINVALSNNGGINGLTLGADGTLTVPPNTPPGVYTVSYQICERLNPSNCDSATVPVVVQGLITGSVWLDSGSNGAGGSNRVRDGGEPPLPGWVVEALFPPGSPNAGQVATTLGGQPASAITNATGAYEIPGLAPGNYQLRFRAPATNGQPGPVVGAPVNGEQNNPQPGSSVNNAARTLDIVVPAGGGLTQQSLPVDPSGVVYDAITRQPVTGATVTLIGPNGQPVPANQLLPGQQGQTVVASGPAAGSYRFDVLPSAPAGAYTIQVSAPTGYTAPSTLIPPQAALAFQAGPAPFQVVPSATAPQVNQPTTYHLQLTLNPAANGADVIHNHIPLDPANVPQLAIEKTANVSQAEVGDLVRYTIRVRNLSPTAAVPGLNVIDRLPLGFAYINNTARRQGAPATLLPNPAGAPGRDLNFTLGNLGANQTIEFSYHVKLGVIATESDGVNRAFAQSGALRSLTAQATVRVGGGVFRAEACFAGKIYSDCGNSVGQGNGNAIQDAGELGIPGVRLYLEDGTYVVSDSEGKYSYCGLRARTHVLKVDETTLPPGTRLGVTSNRNAGDPGSLFLDLKKGELGQADFRNMSCAPAVDAEIKRRRDEMRKNREDVNTPSVEGQGRTGPGLGLERKAPAPAQGAKP